MDYLLNAQTARDYATNVGQSNVRVIFDEILAVMDKAVQNGEMQAEYEVKLGYDPEMLSERIATLQSRGYKVDFVGKKTTIKIMIRW